MSERRLDLREKLYQESVLSAVEAVHLGRRLSGPLVVDLDPTTFCDLGCPECISAELLNQKRFSRDRLLRLAHEFKAAGVRAVVLIGGGEPLTHPATKELIPELASTELHLGLVTNGTLIHTCLDVLSEHMQWVRVSVDAATDTTFAQVRPDKRGGSKFSRVVKNIEDLASRARGSVGFSFLILTRFNKHGEVIFSNYTEIVPAARLAKDLGCTYFEVKAMFDDGHSIVPLPSRITDSVANDVESLKLLEDESFVIETSSTVEALVHGLPTQEKNYTSCPMAELRTVVAPSGVFTCSYHRGRPAAHQGDATSMAFGELWENLTSSPINPSQDCNFHCARHLQNLTILGGLPAESRVVPEYDRFL